MQSSDLELTGFLQQHLRGARAELQVVAECPEIALHLLNADFPQQGLSPEEVDAVMNYPAYWAFCWASGQVVARQVLDKPTWTRNLCVLDFGSGSGIVAIAAALTGAKKVIACDTDPDARVATACNARGNGVELQVIADLTELQDPVDIVLVADLLYDRANLHWLKDLLEIAPRVLVGDSRIRDFSFPGYRHLGTWDSCTFPDLDESAEFRQVNLYLGTR